MLKLYDLRLEAVMHESSTRSTRDSGPATPKRPWQSQPSKHPLNVAFRQTSGYWEMVFGMARHGIIHADFLVENIGEGLLLYARVEPYLAQIRAATSPRAFGNAEWVVANSPMRKALMEGFRARVKRMVDPKT